MTQEDHCSLCTKDIKNLLVSAFTNLLKEWVELKDSTTHQHIVLEIANLVWLFVRIWKGYKLIIIFANLTFT